MIIFLKKLFGLFLFVGVLNNANSQVNISNLNYPNQVGKYTVFEANMNHDESPYTSVWDNVQLQSHFISPAGNTIVVDGFYYDTDTWKVRFAPVETGNYNFSLFLNGVLVGSGSFLSIEVGEKGFIRQHQSNPFRLIYEETNSLFVGLGITGAVEPNPINPESLRGDTSIPGWWGTEPASEVFPWFLPDEANSTITGNHTLNDYFNVIINPTQSDFTRISLLNASGWSLFEDLIDGNSENHYSVIKGKWLDDIVKKYRSEGVRIILDPVGDTPKPLDPSIGRYDYEGYFEISNTNAWAANERYYRYIVARYGAYIDFWELINEGTYTDAWISHMAQYIKSIDPYNHMISASFVPVANPDIDFGGFHTYFTAPDLISPDILAEQHVNKLDEEGGYCSMNNCTKMNFNKPIIFGEAANISTLSYTAGPIAISEEQIKIRVRAWVTFFREGHTLLWAQHWNPDRSSFQGVFFDNELQNYYSAFHDYTNFIGSDINIDQNIFISGGNDVGARVYGLRGNSELYFYIYNPQTGLSTLSPSSNIVVTANVPVSGIGEWFNPTNGAIISTMNLVAGQQNINVPSVDFDLAFRISNRDVIRPTIPINLSSSNIIDTSFNINWTPSSDNIFVDYYKIIIDGVVTQITTNINETIQNLNPDQAYLVKIRAVDTSGNESFDSNEIQVTTSSSSLNLDDNIVKKYSLYPVPAMNNLKLVFNKQGIIKIIIYDHLGRLIRQESPKIHESTNECNIDISSLSSGHYLVKIKSKTQTQTLKFIKL